MQNAYATYRAYDALTASTVGRVDSDLAAISPRRISPEPGHDREGNGSVGSYLCCLASSNG